MLHLSKRDTAFDGLVSLVFFCLLHAYAFHVYYQAVIIRIAHHNYSRLLHGEVLTE